MTEGQLFLLTTLEPPPAFYSFPLFQLTLLHALSTQTSALQQMMYALTKSMSTPTNQNRLEGLHMVIHSQQFEETQLWSFPHKLPIFQDYALLAVQIYHSNWCLRIKLISPPFQRNADVQSNILVNGTADYQQSQQYRHQYQISPHLLVSAWELQ